MPRSLGLTLLEMLVVLLLTAVVLLVTGLHLRQAVRLGMTPLDRQAEALELASRRMLQDIEGCLEVEWVSGQLRLSRAPLGQPGRLPAVGSNWTYDAPREDLVYELSEGQLWRAQASRRLCLCRAERFEVVISADQASLQLELGLGQTTLRRTAYRWLR